MTTNTFAKRFPDAEMSWMNEALPLWIRRQLLGFDMETMIVNSRANSFVSQDLLAQWMTPFAPAGVGTRRR